MPVPPAERERLQLLLPVQRAQPHEGPPARRRVRHQGAAGHDLDLRHPGRTPERRVPGPGPAKHRLQGSGRVRSAYAGGTTWRPDRQAGVQGWGADYPSANNILLSFLCSSYTTNAKTNQNFAGICDRHLDAQVARARSLETTNPAAAAGAWHSADRMLTDEAPWLPMKVFVSTDFVARRVGNYRYCWLSGGSGMAGACLDQLWVR